MSRLSLRAAGEAYKSTALEGGERNPEPVFKVGETVVIRKSGIVSTVQAVNKWNMYQLEGMPSDTLFGARDIRRES